MAHTSNPKIKSPLWARLGNEWHQKTKPLVLSMALMGAAFGIAGYKVAQHGQEKTRTDLIAKMKEMSDSLGYVPIYGGKKIAVESDAWNGDHIYVLAEDEKKVSFLEAKELITAHAPNPELPPMAAVAFAVFGAAMSYWGMKELAERGRQRVADDGVERLKDIGITKYPLN